jgi:hypothetical protein
MIKGLEFTTISFQPRLINSQKNLSLIFQEMGKTYSRFFDES